MTENLPVLILRKLVLLPYQEIRLELNNQLSKSIIDLSINNYESKLLIVVPTNFESNQDINDLPNIGIIGKISKKMELPNNNYRIIINGLNRVKVYNYDKLNDGIISANIKRLYIKNEETDEEKALVRNLKSSIVKYIERNPEASNEVINSVNSIDDLDMLTDIITNYLPLDLPKKIKYMNEFNYIDRAKDLVKDLNAELEMVNIETKIDDDIRDSFQQEQKEFIIKQKIQKLYQEIGINADKQSEISDMKEKINNLPINDRTKEKLLNEVKKYSYTSENNPDSNVIRSYLDTVLSLPWNKYSKDETDLKKIKKSLNNTHYGYEEPKNRILEFIAIKKNSNYLKSPIICLVGPPGTGKTTFAMSVAKALNREFIKISVGGMSDASELIGHRRTYLGSSPGKIIQGLKKCSTQNPVILLDEVDKMTKSYQGDPSAVLLDILDPSQNDTFVDNYIEEPFDLSKVLFILTANDLKNIPDALKDRLEIIEINSYTDEEKINIAKKYLLPNIEYEYNLNKLRINDDTLTYLIRGYTKESGVRDLERLLRKICRNIIINHIVSKTITISLIYKILGPNTYSFVSNYESYYGNSYSLGITPYGGVVIPFEAIYTNNSSSVEIIGNISESVKESCNVAYNYLKSNQDNFKIDSNMFNKSILINALNYGVKKDGSSGGLAICVSLLSLLLNKKIDSSNAFSGEITLHGDILPVGGIKEKIIGAYNNGFTNIYLPIGNKNDILKVNEEIINKLNIVYVSNFREIYEKLFL